MQSFIQDMPQEHDIKLEVSDTFLHECDSLEGESPSNSTLKNNNTNNNDSASTKRSQTDEQDSSPDSNIPGSPLPPRKRAKTHEEKEQRRIERIMRNRQAAHASREKKRKHLEMLEAKCSQLEQENKELKESQTNQEFYKSRVQQLEAAIKAAQKSGQVDDLDKALQDCSSPVPTPTNVSMGTMVPTENTINGGLFPPTARNTHGGSPVPSLVDDCASPDALIIKSEEEDVFSPHSPEKTSIDADLDIYGMMNFNFDSNLSTSAGTLTFSESSSKSRHPAVLTPLSVENFSF